MAMEADGKVDTWHRIHNSDRKIMKLLKRIGEGTIYTETFKIIFTNETDNEDYSLYELYDDNSYNLFHTYSWGKLFEGIPKSNRHCIGCKLKKVKKELSKLIGDNEIKRLTEEKHIENCSDYKNKICNLQKEILEVLKDREEEVVITNHFAFKLKSDNENFIICKNDKDNIAIGRIHDTSFIIPISVHVKFLCDMERILKCSLDELLLKNEKEKENNTTFECRENLAGKKDILNYLDWKINTWEKSLSECEAMDNRNTFKQQHIARESGIVQELKEVRSFIKFSLKK